MLGTGWFAAVAAQAGPGRTVAVVGDGAVGLLGVLAARQLGAERIIAMSRYEPRQKLALAYGATDIVTERGEEGVSRIKDLTNGLGAHRVIEAVGTQESMMQAIGSTRAGGHVGYVGVTHDVRLPGMDLFFSHVHLHGGPAPVRRFLPELMRLIWERRIDPGEVFDLSLPLDQAADGYRAMDRSCSACSRSSGRSSAGSSPASPTGAGCSCSSPRSAWPSSSPRSPFSARRCRPGSASAEGRRAWPATSGACSPTGSSSARC
ncbi:threonine dehydrogenase-like Zn-dependent dehydrogenase [Nonomuraea jabiensis]|uniref:Threonine dehydrogenase-like Zn-dependent dehydrogenase n=1 Tax=Nonomuraea jabiensis TaxID=882448 RepID=A0A7W9LF34_9ACTN|nr:threonine dehydrogenase-like Zn-dependent dehydrogenase [Nonomuraea jabiensis]